MKPQKVYISYALADSQFVPLTARLLEVHNLEPWYAEPRHRDDDRSARQIDDELVRSDILVVIASRHAKAAEWVGEEVTRFTTVNPESPVIAVCVGPIDLDEISTELSGCQAVDCTGDFLAGFRDLLAAMGRDFLSRGELATRRTGSDRRGKPERRGSNVDQRVSMGLLVAYTRHTGNNVSDETPLAPGDIKMLRTPVSENLTSYDFRDDRTGKDVPVATVVDRAFRHAGEIIEAESGVSAVAVLSIISRYVCETYTVSMKDRRTGGRRSDD